MASSKKVLGGRRLAARSHERGSAANETQEAFVELNQGFPPTHLIIVKHDLLWEVRVFFDKRRRIKSSNNKKQHTSKAAGI